MADLSKTVDEILTHVREQADIVSLTDRHTDAMLVRMFNLSWRELRTRLSNAGFSYFLQATSAAALPTSVAVSGEQYLEVDYPTSAVGIYGFDVGIGDRWVPLRQGSFAERRDYQDRYATTRLSKAPEVFVVRTVPVESTTSLTAGKIMLFPADTTGKDYRIWYLPVWGDIAAADAGDHVVYGHDIWFNWVVLDMCIRVHRRDNDSDGALASEERAQQELWQAIVRAVRNVESAGPTRLRPRKSSRARWR